MVEVCTVFYYWLLWVESPYMLNNSERPHEKSKGSSYKNNGSPVTEVATLDKQ